MEAICSSVRLSAREMRVEKIVFVTEIDQVTLVPSALLSKPQAKVGRARLIVDFSVGARLQSFDPSGGNGALDRDVQVGFIGCKLEIILVGIFSAYALESARGGVNSGPAVGGPAVVVQLSVDRNGSGGGLRKRSQREAETAIARTRATERTF